MSIAILILCAICSAAGLVISYKKNKDPFSPIKIFTFFNGFFYLDIYSGNYEISVTAIYLLQCAAITLLAITEPSFDTIKKPTIKINHKKATIILWLLTAIPIFTQLRVISELGGIAQTIGNIAFRVEYFEGRGYLIILNSFMIVLNLLHLQVAIQAKKIQYTIGYAVHFALLILIGLLSGSRSFIAMTALAGCIIFNYQEKIINIAKISMIATTLALLVGVLGQLRNTVTTEDNEITLRNFENGEKFELSHFKYGLIPLEIITSSELKELQYGATYLSLLTNFIPRSIFPEKLESGGIFFTRIYTNDAWGGTSNLATGAITEGIINFGWTAGVTIGMLSILTIYGAGLFLYKRYISSQKYKRNIFLLIPYTYVILLAGRYSYSEFSYIFFSFALTVLLPMVLFVKIYKLKAKL